MGIKRLTARGELYSLLRDSLIAMECYSEANTGFAVVNAVSPMFAASFRGRHALTHRVSANTYLQEVS
jgi:hypothetical protein